MTRVSPFRSRQHVRHRFGAARRARLVQLSVSGTAPRSFLSLVMAGLQQRVVGPNHRDADPAQPPDGQPRSLAALVAGAGAGGQDRLGIRGQCARSFVGGPCRPARLGATVVLGLFRGARRPRRGARRAGGRVVVLARRSPRPRLGRIDGPARSAHVYDQLIHASVRLGRQRCSERASGPSALQYRPTLTVRSRRPRRPARRRARARHRAPASTAARTRGRPRAPRTAAGPASTSARIIRASSRRRSSGPACPSSSSRTRTSPSGTPRSSPMPTGPTTPRSSPTSTTAGPAARACSTRRGKSRCASSCSRTCGG